MSEILISSIFDWKLKMFSMCFIFFFFYFFKLKKGGGERFDQWEASTWSCDHRANVRPQKICMGRGQDSWIHTYKRTSQLLDQIGQVGQFGDNPNFFQNLFFFIEYWYINFFYIPAYFLGLWQSGYSGNQFTIFFFYNAVEHIKVYN